LRPYGNNLNKNSDFEPNRIFTFKELASFLCQDSEDPKCWERMFNLLINDDRNSLLPNVEKIKVVKHETPPTEFIDLGGGTFRNRDDSDTIFETEPLPPEEWWTRWLFLKRYFAKKDFWNADDVKAILDLKEKNKGKNKRRDEASNPSLPEGTKPEDLTLILSLGDILRIQVNEKDIDRFLYGNKSLFDQRSGKPNKNHFLLKVLAEGNGEITIDLINRYQINNRKINRNDLKDLRVWFKKTFDISDNPFYPYKKKQGWIAKFKIIDSAPDLHSLD